MPFDLVYFGFGGGFGLGTPVVSYAPLPMLQMVEDCGELIIVVCSGRQSVFAQRDGQGFCLYRQSTTERK